MVVLRHDVLLWIVIDQLPLIITFINFPVRCQHQKEFATAPVRCAGNFVTPENSENSNGAARATHIFCARTERRSSPSVLTSASMMMS